MSRRMLLMGVAVFATQIASGCCTQRAYLFPRLAGACSGPVFAPPLSPVVRAPLLPRPLLYGAPVVSAPMAGVPAHGGGYGDPSCSSCSSSPNIVSAAPRMGGSPIYTMGGPSYAGGVPHDSVLLPQPTVIPPGTPKVEATTEPKPMPK